MRDQPIFLSESDAARLAALVRSSRASGAQDLQHLQELEAELERAIVVDEAEMPADVVTVGSRVSVLDVERGTRGSYAVVFPSGADLLANRISVLAPLGTALLGYRKGDEVEWLMPGGHRRLRIESVQQFAADAPSGDRLLTASLAPTAA